MRKHQALSFLFLLFIFNTLAFAESLQLIPLSKGTEVETNIYKAKGKSLFLWLYSEAGPQASDHTIALALSKLGIEVWRVDLFSAHFLPIASSSMDRIPDTDFKELIEYAHRKTGKRIIPITTGRGSLPLLKGVRLWQAQHPTSTALSGVILMSPKFFIETPEPGVKGKLLPIVKQTNLPLFILQPKKSPWYWKLGETIPALEKGGSDVLVKRVKGVRDRYYFRPDADAYEKQLTKKLPRTLLLAEKYLSALPAKQRNVILPKTSKKPAIKTGKKERRLKAFKGNPTPPHLSLNNLHDSPVDLQSFKGKVVLVNFWATWCPPCVHEMPSMQKLQNRFSAKGFTILGVNMAEDKKTVQHFLKTKVNVGFPILFDYDGAALKSWGVFAFPTSYVIDKEGKIRYAIFGGVDWETPSIIEKISHLIAE
ncbi:MAG: TlpA disulfide reductase family protein [Woeseiaceae bacterium]